MTGTQIAVNFKEQYIHQQIRKIDFFEFKLDWFREDQRTLRRSIKSQGKRFSNCRSAKLHHYRVRISVNNLSVMLVAVGDCELFFDILLGFFQKKPAVRSNRRCNRHAGQLAHRGACKPVH